MERTERGEWRQTVPVDLYRQYRASDATVGWLDCTVKNGSVINMGFQLNLHPLLMTTTMLVGGPGIFTF